jgi:hypothetical protein
MTDAPGRGTQVAVPVSDPAPEETEQPAKAASFGENDFSAPAGSGGVFGSIRDFWSSVLQADDPPKARSPCALAHGVAQTHM